MVIKMAGMSVLDISDMGIYGFVCVLRRGKQVKRARDIVCYYATVNPTIDLLALVLGRYSLFLANVYSCVVSDFFFHYLGGEWNDGHGDDDISGIWG